MTQLVHASIIQTTKESRKMAEAKLTAFLFNLLGFSLTGIGIVAHLDWWKGTVAFLVGIIILVRNQRYKERRLEEEQEQRKLDTEIKREKLKQIRLGNYLSGIAGEEDEP